jgi:hypothetical protein
MSLIFTLITVAALTFIALIVAFPATRSPLWDAIFIHTLHALGFIIVVLGLIGALGLISGLL